MINGTNVRFERLNTFFSTFSPFMHRVKLKLIHDSPQEKEANHVITQCITHHHANNINVSQITPVEKWSTTPSRQSLGVPHLKNINKDGNRR